MVIYALFRCGLYVLIAGLFMWAARWFWRDARGRKTAFLAQVFEILCCGACALVALFFLFVVLDVFLRLFAPSVLQQ